MLGLYPAAGGPLSSLWSDPVLVAPPSPGAGGLDYTDILGFLIGGVKEVPDFEPLDLIALSGDYLTDAVMLVEVVATDGTLTVEVQDWIMGLGVGGDMPITLRGGEVSLRWSDADWTAQPDDILPNVHFEGRAGEIAFDRSLPIKPDQDRRVAAAKLEVMIDNADGAYDGIEADLSLDGQAVTISVLGHRSHAYRDRRVLLAGAGQPWYADAKSLHVLGASKAYVLDVSMLDLFGGSGGADGGDLLKGKPRLECWGICRGVTPQLVDEPRQIYLLHARAVAEILAVYERAAEIAVGQNRGSFGGLVAAVDALTVAPGTFDYAITAEGTFVAIGSDVEGAVTFDVRGDASLGYTDTHGGMMRRILTRSGIPFSAGAFARLEAIAPGPSGIVFSDQVSFADAVSQIASSAFFWWGDAGDGTIAAGRLAAPLTSGGLLLSEDNLHDDLVPQEPPVPLWRVSANYRRNWTVLDASSIVPPPTITDERWADVQKPSRTTVPRALADRRVRNPNAGDLTLDTLFDQEADALAVCDNILAFMSPDRGLWSATVGLAGLGVLMGQNARLQWSRFGLQAGRDVVVVGQSLRGRSVELMVMG